MIVLAAVWLVARRATLLERGLMQRVLLRLIRLISVASQANIHRVGLGQSRLPARMRIVAVRAISSGSRMRHLGLIYLLGFLGVAGNAQFFCAGCCQHNFALFG